MEMSVARALVELKLLDKRIDRAIRDSVLVGYSVGKKVMTGFSNREEIEKKAKADYQSVIDLIERRNKIKSAIVVSNATTEVSVAEKPMTVAEAIERKNSIDYDKKFLHKLKRVYANTIDYVDSVNSDVKNRLDKHLESLYGKDGKNKAAENEQITKLFKEDNEAQIVDPIDIKAKIERFEKDIEDFEANVDLVLSESNALTKIEIPE